MKELRFLLKVTAQMFSDSESNMFVQLQTFTWQEKKRNDRIKSKNHHRAK